ncbi:MAG TPA: LamG-like jellyroll fold domain-containing protein [Sedimentisphaerales bacterium]|nr:LamG-like jellyroll fold domain-containing protein [Sedimentisphaerales bacterium]
MKRIFGELKALAVILAMTSVCAAIADVSAPVAHYEFESNGNDSTYTVVGDAKIMEDSKRGNVLSLDGSGDYLDCGRDSVLNIRKEITVACWVKFERPPTSTQPLICKGSQSWTLAREADTGTVSFYCNNVRPTQTLYGIKKVPNAEWHHIAGVYDGSIIRVYVDGNEDASTGSSGELEVHEGDSLWIGAELTKRGKGWQDCSGLIDDVAIFDSALNAEQIGQLYRQGLALFMAGPTLQSFIDTVRNAEAEVKKQRPQEAIAFLEKQIAEHEKWKQQNQNHVVLYYKQMLPDLHYLLAKAREAAGAPKEEVVNEYKQAVESDAFSCLSMPRQGPALLWLYGNVNTQAYEDAVEPLMQSDRGFLRAVATMAKLMMAERKPKVTMGFLEANLAAYSRWQDKHPYADISSVDSLPEVYFHLAKAKEADGASKQDIANAYSRTFSPSRIAYVPERTAALIWLFENDCMREFTEIIKSFTQSRDVKKCFDHVVENVCAHFESREKWAELERFLDVLFTTAEHPYEWVIVVESWFNSKATRSAKKYSKYLENKPGLKFGRDCLVAEKYIAEAKFDKAAELYRSIVNRRGPEDDEALYEFQLCRCLFDGGRYREAASQLESFTANNKKTSRSLIAKGVLMKGQAELQLGEPDRAMDSFFVLMMEYPEAKNVPEIIFFIGRCYMLQGKFKAAAEAFNSIIRGYPESSHVGAARTYVTRIRNLAE